MEILVLGGTGAIGAHLVSLLSNIGGAQFVCNNSKEDAK